MIENWEQYKDLEYYLDRFCKCGCGGRIRVQPHHKYFGFPVYIDGHAGGRRKTPIEIRICACGCGETFECKVDSQKRYINGHNRRGKCISRETRICECGCGDTFECKINSKQRFIYGHSKRNISLSKEHRKKIGKSHLGKTCTGRKKLPRIKKICPGCGIEFVTPIGWQERRFHTQECYWEYMERVWSDPEYKVQRLGRIRYGSRKKPNRPEKFLIQFLQQFFPDQWKYVGNFKFWVGRKNPDFIHVNQKKIIEHFGDYYHGEGKTSVPNDQHEQEKINYFAQHGYQTLVIWQHELENECKLEERLLQFNQQ